MRRLAALLALASLSAFAEPIREKIEKHWDAIPADNQSETIPDSPDEMWGKWHFWNGQWWAVTMFQKESHGPSWDRPRKGYGNHWDSPKAVWMRVKRLVPREWHDDGSRLVVEQNGIKGCDVTFFVNRKKIGVIKPPSGSLEITDAVKYGLENEFHMLLKGNGRFRLEKDPPMFIVKPPVSVDDVFADTSWREKKLTVETTVTTSKKGKAEVLAEVVDADGKVVKKVSGKFDLEKGENVLKPSVAWADPITWELGRGYMYTLRTTVKIDKKPYKYKDIRFGFREIWREGKRIFMNGHEQKFRVTYNFGCNKYGAKFLQGVGYNCIQFAHRTELDPQIDEGMLEYLSENGISAIVPTCAFDWNTKVPLLKPGEKREEFKRIQAKNLRRYRNWPCVAMVYMGVNCYLPQWSYEAKYLGCGDRSDFAKMMTDLVASAKKTNPNVLYFSHSDGSTGEIASANLYFNWIPLQERVEWPSAWAGDTGKFPFQACEFGHPYQYSWYQDKRDLVTELLAIYYGEEAYRTEPAKISDRHVEALYIRRMQHPLFWRFTDDFVTRLTRAWRTYGINAGIVWFNLDYGFGMPGWKLEEIYNKYAVNYNFFKKEEDVPKGRPEWAFPSWDIYRKTNLDFLGWIGGAPDFVNRRHAYYSGEMIEKQCILLWDGFDARSFSAKWTATLDGRAIASGDVKRKLESNVPSFAPIAFEAPKVAKKGKGTISAVFYDAKGEKLSEDSVDFEVYAKKSVPWQKSPAFALYDPEGKTAAELKSRGLSNFTPVDSLSAANGAKFLVVGANTLAKDGGFKALPMDAVKDGLRVLVLRQSADAWKAFGFEVQDRSSRILYLRDHVSPALRAIDDDALREWSGAGPQQFVGHARHEPRWNGNMSLAALQLKSPSVVGYRPQIDGEFDLNYSALLDYAYGNGGVKFCTLEFFGRGASDAAVDRTFNAVFADFLFQGGAHDTAGAPAIRGVVAVGVEANKIVSDLGAHVAGKSKAESDDLLLVGSDAKMSAADVNAAARRGANVLVVANDEVAKGLGLSVRPCKDNGVYLVKFDRENPLLRGVGQSQLRWRDRLKYSRLSAKTDWSVDAEGLIATKTLKNGAKIVVTSFDPYAIERGITADRVLVVDGKPREKPIGEKNLADCRRRADISFERSRQLVARLLTNLGAAPGKQNSLYSGLVRPLDPYFYTYW